MREFINIVKQHLTEDSAFHYPKEVSVSHLIEMIDYLHQNDPSFDISNIDVRLLKFKKYRLEYRNLPNLSKNVFWKKQLGDGIVSKIPPIIYDETDNFIIDGHDNINLALKSGEHKILAYVGYDIDTHWSDDDSEDDLS